MRRKGEVLSIGSFVIDGRSNPCGHSGTGKDSFTFRLQITNIVDGLEVNIAECPECGATWDDNL